MELKVFENEVSLATDNFKSMLKIFLMSCLFMDVDSPTSAVASVELT